MAFGVRMSPAQLAALAGPCLACCLLGGAFGLATVAALPNQRSAMQIFQFLIIPQYVLGGVLVPLRGSASTWTSLAHLMPMRYVVELTRAAFYAGTPGYREVVSGRPAVDAAVTAAPVRHLHGHRGGRVRLPGAHPLIRPPPARARTRADTTGSP